jgi:hypothetical protein
MQIKRLNNDIFGAIPPLVASNFARERDVTDTDKANATGFNYIHARVTTLLKGAGRALPHLPRQTLGGQLLGRL